MNVVLWKWIVLVVLFFSSFFLILLPLKLVTRLRSTVDPLVPSRHDRVISLLSCFAGGVFMATGLLDLLPQVVGTFAMVKENLQLNSSFPVAEFSVAIGFFLVLILEQLVLDCKENSNISTSPVDILSAERCEHEQRRLLHRRNSIDVLRDLPNSVNPKAGPHPSLRSLLLVAALSLHSLFDGLAVGLQPNVASLLQIAMAVMLHKSVVAFSLGLNLARTDFKVGTILWSSFIFSVMSPIGIGIGLGVIGFGRSALTIVTTAVLEGLACGTFIYVTFFEVLPHELKSCFNRKLKLFMIIVGFAVICGLLLLDL